MYVMVMMALVIFQALTAAALFFMFRKERARANELVGIAERYHAMTVSYGVMVDRANEEIRSLMSKEWDWNFPTIPRP